MQRSAFDLKMLADVPCKMQCTLTLERADVELLVKRIRDQYRVNMNLDGMPAMMQLANDAYLPGYPLGEMADGELKVAVPFTVLIEIFALWFMISLPLSLLGSYYGLQRSLPDPPVQVNLIPRHIPPQPWYLRTVPSMMIGGLLPFGAVFVELFFIVSSVWQHQIYAMFGFLFWIS